MNDESFKLPRLYTPSPLIHKGVIALSSGQAHYLHNVLRRKEGNSIRLFNGKDGEWLATLQNLNKKSGEALLQDSLAKQPENVQKIHLLFAPIKKNRMDWLIEKSVELGVSDFHPVLTQNTEVKKIKENRITAQIFEASEQCERFEIPTLHPLKKLDEILKTWPAEIGLLACLERYDGQPLQNITQNVAVLIGPEGGFTAEEKKQIAKKSTAITLGEQVLRSETAALKAIALLTR